jgi:hypothetical protein
LNRTYQRTHNNDNQAVKATMFGQVVSKDMPAIVAETSFLHQDPNDGNVCLPLLMLEIFEKVRRVAPGWDIYCLEGL